MNRNYHRIFSLAAVTLFLSVLVFVLGGTPGSASVALPETENTSLPGEENISPSKTRGLSTSASQPWTPERMRAAKPYPLESLGSDFEYSLQLSQLPGTPTFIPGSAPAASNWELAQNGTQTTSLAEVSGYTYPAPYARYQNFDSYTVYPYSTVGVLFFSQYGFDYRCSAASIGNHAIWTAGHCIHKGDGKETGWSYDLFFVPAYKNGAAPLGVWTRDELNPETIRTTDNWYQYGDLQYDMGGAVLNDWNGQKLSDVVGSLGFAYNQNNGLHWLNMGYPSAAPFNGGTQQICAASFAYSDTSMPGPAPVAMGCDMTRGSSGGPWIMDFSGQAGGNYLNGNNSYRYSIHPEELFSPYFGSDAKLLYDELVAGSP